MANDPSIPSMSTWLQFYDYGDRRAWGYALEHDRYEDLTSDELAIIEEAKSLGWHVIAKHEGAKATWLLRPSVTDQEPSLLWFSHVSEEDAWTKLPLGFRDWTG